MKSTEQVQYEKTLREQDKRLDDHKREVFDTLIAEQVLHTLGQPKEMIQVQVRRLWEDHYRVNIFAGAGITSSKIVNSYFLTTDSNGNIVTAIPKIVKQY
jgi:hypothetical protein